MKYILLKDGRILKVGGGLVCDKSTPEAIIRQMEKDLKLKKGSIVRIGDSIRDVCDKVC